MVENSNVRMFELDGARALALLEQDKTPPSPETERTLNKHGKSVRAMALGGDSTLAASRLQRREQRVEAPRATEGEGALRRWR
ncbi:hypothetical protein GUJ93_ZPchr0003g17568 [Zizania palustris]|uniref:Uncharacterized protein n=1 Tax=Zizania palustris TaxID=103762 RepID=A0A8J5SFD4_ZIZPA|nr:hypothetical protein GUJ93_ZPchr0003g17568 [Zizania palustris]